MTYLYVGDRAPGGEDKALIPSFGVYRFDEKDGSLSLVQRVNGGIGCGAVITDEERGLLYVTDEVFDNRFYGKRSGGSIVLYSVNKATGELTFLQDVPSYGDHPSYIAADKSWTYMITTHFGVINPNHVLKEDEGKLSFLPAEEPDVKTTYTVLRRINPDGTVGYACDVLAHPAEDGFESHMHCVVTSPDGKFFVACDMGQDKVYMFKIDEENGKLILSPGSPYQYAHGRGTRYAAFHPNKPFIIVNCEHSGDVLSFGYNSAGELTLLGTVDTLAGGLSGMPSGCAITPDGRYFYNAHRESDMVSVIEINQETGALKLLQNYKMRGVKPRSCAVSPDGGYLIVSNTVSNLVEVIRIGQDGLLAPTDNDVTEPFPGTLTFMEL